MVTPTLFSDNIDHANNFPCRFSDNIDSGKEDEGDDEPISIGMKKVTALGREMDSVERMASEIRMYFKDTGESMI